MAQDFYPFVDAPAPGNEQPSQTHRETGQTDPIMVRYATRIAVYDDMLSTPRVMVVEPADVRQYLEEITNTVYRTLREQGGRISLMVVRELVENFIHARFTEPVISILDDGNTIRFADQGPGIEDKERAFEFGITSANSDQKRYIRGTGAGLPMVEQYLENAGGVISIENNLNQGTVVTVSINQERIESIKRSVSRGAVVRGWGLEEPIYPQPRTEFSTNQQPSSLLSGVHSYPQNQRDHTASATEEWEIDAHISERGLMAIGYAMEKGSVGPTELTAAFGDSNPTWSRELSKLSTLGLLVKQGQKRTLTEMGKMWAKQHEVGTGRNHG